MQQHDVPANENLMQKPATLLKESGASGSTGGMLSELPSTGVRLERSMSHRSSLRPLAASNRGAEDDFKRPSARLPKKNASVGSTDREYMFGW